MASRYDEVLDRWVNEHGVPDEEAQMFRSNKLREELEQARKDAAEGKNAKAELEKLRKQPKVESALAEFGVDMQSLNARDRAIVSEKFPEFEDAPDKEKVAEFLQTWGFDANVSQEEQTQEKPQAQRITEFALSAPLSGKAAGPTTPKDFASWDPARQRQFIRSNPQAYEQLKRGEAVSV